MAKRRTILVAFLICFCLFAMPFYANAASTSNAKEPIDINKKAALTVSYIYNETAFSGIEVKLYKVASVSKDFQFTLVENFKDTNLTLNGITSTNEWDQVRSTLENYIFTNNIAPLKVDLTNQNGQVAFNNLEVGLYLAAAENIFGENVVYFLDSALITLPTLNKNNLWQYNVNIASKVEAISTTPETEYKVLKLWKGDKSESRPKSIEVEIYKDKMLYKKVTLSKENNWSYSWVEKGAATFRAVERNVPTGYVMTTTANNNTFVITNTKTEIEPFDPPKTGDTSNMLPYIIIMNISGAVLIILGIIRKRKGI